MADTNPTPTKAEKNFDETLAKLTEALKIKFETNYLDELQVNQIIANFKETKNYADIEQYLK